ncbi:hypothetical protein ACFO3J_17275 [Streptomyces polygonati]|uniref:Uncharacterized protein n=1 Tax=Streptomyces polygonati TaxID=1617087 RepID=A0ABV8HMK5_9ACTN
MGQEPRDGPGRLPGLSALASPSYADAPPATGSARRASPENFFHNPTGSTDSWTPPVGGLFIIQVRAQDASGRWGYWGQIEFKVA